MTNQAPERTEITEADLRRWLSLLGKPDQLAVPAVIELLRAHGKLPDTDNPVVVGHAAATFLMEAMERLRPPEDSGRDGKLPHLVLRTCFVERAKHFQAAALLGLSERQLSRERSRALNLLKIELEGALPKGDYRPERIPTIRGFLPRPSISKALETTLESEHLVNAHGPPGIGKTSLVAELAAGVESTTTVLWYRVRREINDSLTAILFHIGDFLEANGRPDLSRYIKESLPRIDLSIATRLALKDLDNGRNLIILDDYHLVEDDSSIAGFLDEMLVRLPDVRVLTLSRHRFSRTLEGTSFEISPLTRTETRALLEHLGVTADLQLVRSLHAWTHGITNLVKLAASWLKVATPEEVAAGVKSLRHHEEVQTFLLSNVTEILDSDDRAVLQAASIFRERFNDDALSFVAQRTRGEVTDASLRLVRNYAATRSREGDCAFIHASVRDYIYDRLPPATRAALHERASRWYGRNNHGKEAAYHQRQAEALDQSPGLIR